MEDLEPDVKDICTNVTSRLCPRSVYRDICSPMLSDAVSCTVCIESLEKKTAAHKSFNVSSSSATVKTNVLEYSPAYDLTNYCCEVSLDTTYSESASNLSVIQV